MFDLGKEAFQIDACHLGRIAGKAAEDSLHPRFVNKKEGPGICYLQFAQLTIGLTGHEIKEEGPHLVIENHRFFIFIQDIQPETHRTFQLTANRCIPG